MTITSLTSICDIYRALKIILKNVYLKKEDHEPVRIDLIFTKGFYTKRYLLYNYEYDDNWTTMIPTDDNKVLFPIVIVPGRDYQQNLTRDIVDDFISFLDNGYVCEVTNDYIEEFKK